MILNEALVVWYASNGEIVVTILVKQIFVLHIVVCN